MLPAAQRNPQREHGPTRQRLCSVHSQGQIMLFHNKDQPLPNQITCTISNSKCISFVCLVTPSSGVRPDWERLQMGPCTFPGWAQCVMHGGPAVCSLKKQTRRSALCIGSSGLPTHLPTVPSYGDVLTLPHLLRLFWREDFAFAWSIPSYWKTALAELDFQAGRSKMIACVNSMQWATGNTLMLWSWPVYHVSVELSFP